MGQTFDSGLSILDKNPPRLLIPHLALSQEADTEAPFPGPTTWNTQRAALIVGIETINDSTKHPTLQSPTQPKPRSNPGDTPHRKPL